MYPDSCVHLRGFHNPVSADVLYSLCQVSVFVIEWPSGNFKPNPFILSHFLKLCPIKIDKKVQMVTNKKYLVLILDQCIYRSRKNRNVLYLFYLFIF